MTEAAEALNGNLMLTPMDTTPRTRMVFGCGTLERLGELARETGAHRVLVVSDPGVVAAGHTQRAIASLEAKGLITGLFDGARENPTTAHVAAGVAFARQVVPDLIVGIGGGSSMDCAKGINFLLTNGGRMQDYWGVDKATQPMLPLICVPTTSGTGSEMQSFALISDEETHIKMACGDRKTAARVAILDPELTLTQPPSVTALTAVDALSHAVETFVSKRRNAISRMYSRESFRLLSSSILQVFQEPTNLEARSAMHLGASFSGLAIENSMLGAAHALANPLTARFDTAHGQAVGMMLPHVVRFNQEVCDEDYQELMTSYAGDTDLLGEGSAAEQLADWLGLVIKRAGLASTLSGLNLSLDDPTVAELSAAAARQWTGTFNPRPIDDGSLATMYRAAF